MEQKIKQIYFVINVIKYFNKHLINIFKDKIVLVINIKNKNIQQNNLYRQQNLFMEIKNLIIQKLNIQTMKLN